MGYKKMSFEIPEPFVWDQSFKVGIEDCCKDKKSADKWNKLKGLVVDHFKFEEDLMKETGAETFDSHKKKHDDFVNTCTSLSIPLPGGFDDIAKNWLVNHIKVTDQNTKFK